MKPPRTIFDHTRHFLNSSLQIGYYKNEEGKIRVKNTTATDSRRKRLTEGTARFDLSELCILYRYSIDIYYYLLLPFYLC